MSKRNQTPKITTMNSPVSIRMLVMSESYLNITLRSPNPKNIIPQASRRFKISLIFNKAGFLATTSRRECPVGCRCWKAVGSGFQPQFWQPKDVALLRHTGQISGVGAGGEIGDLAAGWELISGLSVVFWEPLYLTDAAEVDVNVRGKGALHSSQNANPSIALAPHLGQ